MGNVIVMYPGLRYKIVKANDVIGMEGLKSLIGGWVCIALRIPGKHADKLWPEPNFTEDTIFFCDDDGMAKQLELTWLRPTDRQPIVGPVVIAQYKPVWHEDGPDENYTTLSKNQEECIVSWLKLNNCVQVILDESIEGMVLSESGLAEA